MGESRVRLCSDCGFKTLGQGGCGYRVQWSLDIRTPPWDHYEVSYNEIYFPVHILAGPGPCCLYREVSYIGGCLVPQKKHQVELKEAANEAQRATLRQNWLNNRWKKGLRTGRPGRRKGCPKQGPRVRRMHSGINLPNTSFSCILHAFDHNIYVRLYFVIRSCKYRQFGDTK